MRHWENYTCITFVERQPVHHDYIYFTQSACGYVSFDILYKSALILKCNTKKKRTVKLKPKEMLQFQLILKTQILMLSKR